jgi:hypothetical protein
MAASTYVHITKQYTLQQACRALVDAFDWSVYQVGSSLRRRDWHDIDVRCILDDDEFARMFPGEEPGKSWRENPRLALLNAALSEWMQARTGLPVDFQFQQQTAANAEFSGPEHPRSALGIVTLHRPDSVSDSEKTDSTP